jgi:hypothetical protein
MAPLIEALYCNSIFPTEIWHELVDKLNLETTNEISLNLNNKPSEDITFIDFIKP